MRAIMGTAYLPPKWLAAVFIVGLFNIIIVEFGKWLFNHTHANK
jgi:hypothetical protein